MPWPVIVLIIGGAILSTAGGAILGRILDYLSGKTITVFGEREVGKTTLATFLSTGHIPEEYDQTTHAETKPGRHIDLSKYELNVREVRDVPGGKEYYRIWREEFNDSHVILYMFRADKIWDHEEETLKRILADARHIAEWNKSLAGPAKKRIRMVGTFCDKIPEFAELRPENRGDFKDRMLARPVIRELRLILGPKTKLVLGSLQSETSTERLVRGLIHSLEKN